MNQKKVVIFVLSSLAIPIAIGQACSDVKLKQLQVPPPHVSLVISNYCPWTGFNYKDMFSYNQSAYFLVDHWENDFDRDGLPDVWESNSTNQALFNISPTLADTNGDGYSDLVVFKNGLLTSAQNLLATQVLNGASQLVPCTALTDSDNDGLTDCEEALLGLQKTWPDTDFDGIPDGIEYRFGMNPNNANDVQLSPMGDNYTNYQHVKAGFPTNVYIDSDNATQMISTNVVLDTVATKNSYSGEPCYQITVSNIPLVGVSNGNKIVVQAVEDNRTPANGTTNIDRELRTLTVYAPRSIPDKSTIIVVVPPDRKNAQNNYIGMDGYVVGAPGGIPLVVQSGG